MRTIDDSSVLLPDAKRRELAFVVDIIRQGFADAIRLRTQPRYRNGRILKIVLFGSYARGDWVEDPVGRYFSDYDILVVVDHEDLTDVPEFWLKTDQRLLAELAEGTRLRTQVSPIFHSLDDVNEKLRLGRYFFTDILRDGIVLFEGSGYPFAEPGALSPAQALGESSSYFEEWFRSAENFHALAAGAEAQGMPKEAAFLFHQATERFYHCVFLVRTLYSPKTHSLNRLRSQLEELEPRLREVWPTATKFERRAYNLLREAYIKARYSPAYVIGPEELAWLAARVALLRDLVRGLCSERLEELANAA